MADATFGKRVKIIPVAALQFYELVPSKFNGIGNCIGIMSNKSATVGLINECYTIVYAVSIMANDILHITFLPLKGLGGSPGKNIPHISRYLAGGIRVMDRYLASCFITQ